jgi:carbon monoxide dehydrogenase subunit G
VVTRRSRVIAAPVEDVWAVVADPWALVRWWPHTRRVEGVDEHGWTTVLANERSGRSVRADWRLEGSEPPAHRRWAQELEDSPFARLFGRNVVDVRLEPAAAGTSVTLAFDQKIRGWARLAPFIIRGAMRRQLDEALAGLAGAVERGE